MSLPWKFSSVKQPETVSNWNLYAAEPEWFMHLSFLICWNKVSTFLFHCTSHACRDKEVRMEKTPLKRIAKSTRQFVQTYLFSQVFCCEGATVVDNHLVTHLQILSVFPQYDSNDRNYNNLLYNYITYNNIITIYDSIYIIIKQKALNLSLHVCSTHWVAPKQVSGVFTQLSSKGNKNTNSSQFS